MKVPKFYLQLFLGCTFFLLYGQCQSDEGSTVQTLSPTIDTIPAIPAISVVEANYINYCGGCHGQKVNAFVDRNWKNGDSKDEILQSIRYGIVQNGMPAYDTTFTAIELDELADFILEAIADLDTYTPQEDATPKYYSTEQLELQIDTIVGDLQVPWSVEVTKDGTIYFTEKSGALYRKRTNGSLTEIKGCPDVKVGIQGGLLDLALHPDFETNQTIYFSYSKPDPHSPNSNLATTAVMKAKIVDDRLEAQEDIFIALPYVDTKYHFGSRIVFDNAGYLYVSVGDRGRRDDHPQYLTNGCGKIHRMHDDGRIPTDNPFYDTPDAVKTIWSYGHRNIQGMAYDTDKDKLWAHEHGPRGGDELNLIKKGGNYGWPLISYGLNYNGTTFTDITSQDGYIDPLNYWIPSIAPSGLAIVQGPKYGPWEGDLLSGSLRYKFVSRINTYLDKVAKEERVLNSIGRVRDVQMGADGFLYISVEKPGRILRVTVR